MHLNVEARRPPWELRFRNHHLEFLFETESPIASIKLADQWGPRAPPVTTFLVLSLKAHGILESKLGSCLTGGSFSSELSFQPHCLVL